MNINVDLPNYTPEEVSTYLSSWYIPESAFKITHFRERFTVIVLDNDELRDIVDKLRILEEACEQKR